MRITGAVDFQNEWTGEYRDIRVSFEADSEDAWVDIVDRAVEIASEELTLSWVTTGDRLVIDEHTLGEIELEGC